MLDNSPDSSVLPQEQGSTVTQSPLQVRDKASVGNTLVLVCATIYLVIILTFFSFLEFRKQGDWAFAIGYEIGAALIPSIVVLLYYRKKKNISSARIIFVASSWILFANLISSRTSGNHVSEVDIPVIAKEAAGTVSVTDPNNQGKAALRDYFKDVIAQNKEYETEVAKIHWDNLYTPKSYLDPSETNRVLAGLRDVMRLEKQQETALTTITNRLKDRINALDWSDNTKEQFIKGFDKKYTETLRSRKLVLESENEFLDSLQELYTLVSANRRYFKMSGGKLVTIDDKVLNEFNKAVGITNERRIKYQSALKSFNQQRDQSVEKLGLSNREFGISE